ncbi:sigma-54-dependent transcriptional regulator [Bacillus tuaregi]|uniref:sigma-54-dependent transcriptional regulator n=1 Tax=Bacillus tuaregi TaxID=1816695 RepID=UPI0008F90E0B|nr:sigma-54 dependent transcriptional regulator [Bacillus tuaregi]
MSTILVVDDEKDICIFLRHLLSEKGHQVTLCTSRREFDDVKNAVSFDLAFLDVRLPDGNGLEILKDLKTSQPLCKVIVMTGYSTVKTAVEAIKLGAYDFIEKPFDEIEEIERITERLLTGGVTPSHDHVHDLATQIGCFIGQQEEMNQLFSLAYKFAQKNVNILIEGETGTGKEVLAHFIHEASQRSHYPFIGVNCGAISEHLLESELFGHTKGSFTGAAKDRKGFFELADKGTLFLDEIGEASLATQVKLLRVLETGEFMKVGGETVQRSKARLITASHVDLHQAVTKGTFREDLLYRLDVVKLTIPPLRKRVEDIPQLIDDYVKRHQLKLSFTEDTLQLLKSYNWPGNIRELVNIIKRAAALAEGETAYITPDYLPTKITSPIEGAIEMAAAEEGAQFAGKNLGFDSFLDLWQQEIRDMWKSEEITELQLVLDGIKRLETEAIHAFIEKSLKKTVGNRKEAVEGLGITMRKLRYYLNEKK